MPKRAVPATTTNPATTWEDVERFACSQNVPGVAIESTCRAVIHHPDDDERYLGVQFIVAADSGEYDVPTLEPVRKMLARVGYLFDKAMYESTDAQIGVAYSSRTARGSSQRRTGRDHGLGG
jgi:hypothetical protein